jgi:hypothetical protein
VIVIVIVVATIPAAGSTALQTAGAFAGIAGLVLQLAPPAARVR